MAFWAASTPASSVKWSSRVPVEAPEPLAAHVSTIAVANAVISDVSSVWARGIVVEAIAIRSRRIVTSPPRMRPSRRRPSSSCASSASRPEAPNFRSAPPAIFQPASTSPSSPSARWSRRGERDELGVDDRGPPRLDQRALGAGRREVARLAAEADPPALRRVEDGLDAEAVRFGRLGLLHAVAGDVRGVVEPGQHGRVRGHEHLGLADVALTRNECQRFLARPGQLVDRPHRLLSARAALSGSAPRQDSLCPSSPGAPPRARGDCATRAGTGCRWPPGTARAGTFNRRLPDPSARSPRRDRPQYAAASSERL